MTIKTVDDAMDLARTRFNPEVAKGVKLVYQYCVTGEGGRDYYLDIDDGKLAIGEGRHPSPSVTFTVALPDFITMLTDRAQAQSLFMQGKVKADPLDLAAIMRLAQLLPERPPVGAK